MKRKKLWSWRKKIQLPWTIMTPRKILLMKSGKKDYNMLTWYCVNITDLPSLTILK